jgi:hypothetical protein
MTILSDGFSIDMAIKSDIDICYQGYLIAMISCYGSDKYGVGINKLHDRCLCVDEV